MDYQNVHLTGHDLFAGHSGLQRHESLIDPLLFAAELIRTRNRIQRTGYDHAVLSRVLVYRGLPSPDQDAEQYARNLAQKAHWERDPRVRVTSRPLKYDYERDASGRRVLDVNRRPITVGRPRERRASTSCALLRSCGKLPTRQRIWSSSLPVTATCVPPWTRRSTSAKRRSRRPRGTTRFGQDNVGRCSRMTRSVACGTPACRRPSSNDRSTAGTTPELLRAGERPMNSRPGGKLGPMGGRRARVEDVHELALGMPHVTVVQGSGDNPVYQVGGKSLQLLAEVRDRTGLVPAAEFGASLPARSSLASRALTRMLFAATIGRHARSRIRRASCAQGPRRRKVKS